ncbi:MAG: hypothetical protein ACI9YU_000536 [Flavobacteriales bacterium]|jgi:hypothetical protein
MKERLGFLITGMSRSGTTLVDKLLGAHKELSVLSQPLPFLYRHLKKQFFKQIEYPETYYVLNDLFDERRYEPGHFFDYLDRFQLTEKELTSMLENMDTWSGQLTKLDPSVSNEVTEGEGFDQLYSHLLSLINTKSDAKCLGSKEILIEEYVGYFLSKGIKAIVVVRDPRDVITSQNIGRGTDYVGRHRPTLFHLRNWRKSVAICNTFQDNPNFLSFKYEDLLLDQNAVLRKVTEFLKVNPFPSEYFDNGIPTMNGNWNGNSSTGETKGINSTNSGKYRKHLNSETVKYIELMCRPEMLSHNYELEYPELLDSFDPTTFQEQFQIDSDSFIDKNMSSNAKILEQESKRLEVLTHKSSNSSSEVNRYFYSRANYNSLIRFC